MENKRRIIVGGTLQKPGKQIDDVIGRELAGVQMLVRQRAFDELLEVLSGRFAAEH